MGNQITRLILGTVAAAFACTASDGMDWSGTAIQLYREGHYREAERAYRRALDAFDRDGEGAALNRALTVENIAVMLRAQGRYAESERLHREAIPRIEELAGANSAQAARAASNLAALYWSLGRLEEAEPLAVRAEVTLRDLGPRGGRDRDANRHILAAIYLGQHRYAESEKISKSTLESGGASNMVTAYSNLAAAALGVNENARAEEYARKAVELAERELPARHPLMAVALNNLAQSCRFQEKNLEAESYYRQAIAIWEDALGRQHPDLARGLMNMAAFYHERGREAGAEDLYMRAAAILESSIGKHAAEALVARSELADVLRAERRYTEAAKLSRATLGEMQGKMREDDARLVRARLNWSRLQVETQSVAVMKKTLR